MSIIITQLLGGIAWFIDVLSYWFKRKKQILLFQIISELCFSVHYYLLAAKTGTIICVLNLVREIGFYYIKTERMKKVLCSIMILIYIILCISTIESVIDLFPILAEITYCYSLMGESEDIIIGGIIDAIYWFFYGIINHSYVGAMTDMLMIFSNSVILIKRKNNYNRKSAFV